MPMAYQSKRLARCSATQNSRPRRSTPASSTKPSAARWTNSPKPSAAQALALVEGKVRRKKLLPQRKLQPQPTLLYQQPQPQTYKHNKGARPRRAPLLFLMTNLTIPTHHHFQTSQQGSLRTNLKMLIYERSNQDYLLTYPPYRRNHSWHTPP